MAVLGADEGRYTGAFKPAVSMRFWRMKGQMQGKLSGCMCRIQGEGVALEGERASRIWQRT